MNRNNQTQISIGATPRADFLPPRVKIEHDARSNRRRLLIATIGVSVFAAGAFLACQSLLLTSQAHLDESRATTEQILIEQGNYSDIVSLVDESKKLGAAYALSSANEIDWSQISKLVAKALPEKGQVTSLSLSGPSAAESAVSVDEATKAKLLATINVSIQSPTLQGVEYFLLDARQWPGYLNSSVFSVQKNESGFRANLLIGLGAGALAPAGARENIAAERLAK